MRAAPSAKGHRSADQTCYKVRCAPHRSQKGHRSAGGANVLKLVGRGGRTKTAKVWRAPLGMLHAGVDQKRLKCNIFKTLFRSARLGRARCTRHAPGGHGMTFPGPRLHADDQWPCSQGLRCMGRLFGSTVKRALNIRIRWRPPSAHQAAAAAGRAIGAPHRYHRSAPSQCSTA